MEIKIKGRKLIVNGVIRAEITGHRGHITAGPNRGQAVGGYGFKIDGIEQCMMNARFEFPHAYFQDAVADARWTLQERAKAEAAAQA